MTRFQWIGLAASALSMFIVGSIPENAGSEPFSIVVAVVEPRVPKPGSEEVGYSVSLSGSKQFTVKSILDELRQSKGMQLVLLVHEAVPAGTVPVIASLGTKAGFRDFAVFIFDAERRGMAAVPDLKWVDFSTDSEMMKRYFN